MLLNLMRLPYYVQELMIHHLRLHGLMGHADPSAPLPFTVAFIDAACCRPNNSSEIVEVAGTIPHCAQRLNAVAPLLVDAGYLQTMMMPDFEDTRESGGLFFPDQLHRQWDNLLYRLNNRWKDGSAHRIPRGDYYRWLAGQEVGLPKIDVTIRCGNERANYGNLTLTFDLAKSSLRTLPRELWSGLQSPIVNLNKPTRIEALQRLGHMNSVVVCSYKSAFAKREVPRYVPVFDLGKNSSFLGAFNLVKALHLPDRHVQPKYRGVSSPCAIFGEEINGLSSSLNGHWREISIQRIEIAELTRELQGFWLGLVLQVTEPLDSVLVLTTGVTREAEANWLK